MATPNLTLASEVKYLKGVGPARAEILAARGIRTVEDFLYYTPFRYEDRTHITRIRDLVPGQTATVFAQVLTCGLMRTRKGVYIYDLAARDDSGMIRCKWFNAVYLEKHKVFRQGQRVFFYGKVERDFYGTSNLEIVQPQFEILPEKESESGDSIEVGRVVPIYEGMGNLGTRVIRRLISTALTSLGDNLPDRLPLSVREKNQLVDRATALRQTHFPASDQPLELLCNFRTPAQVRLIFEEFFNVGAGLALRRRNAKAAQGIEFEPKASGRAAKRLCLHPVDRQQHAEYRDGHEAHAEAQPQIERLPKENPRKERDPVLGVLQFDVEIVGEGEVVGARRARQMESALFGPQVSREDRQDQKEIRDEERRQDEPKRHMGQILLVRAEDRDHQQRQEQERDVRLEVARADGVAVDRGEVSEIFDFPLDAVVFARRSRAAANGGRIGLGLRHRGTL